MSVCVSVIFLSGLIKKTARDMRDWFFRYSADKTNRSVVSGLIDGFVALSSGNDSKVALG